MASKRTFLVVGAGLAGSKAAEALRAEGFDGRVLLVGDEPVRPYERPPLSKEYLRGEKGFEDAAVHAEDFYDAQEIELVMSAAVTAIDPHAAMVTLDDGKRIACDRLLLATGAAPRRLAVPGGDLDGVQYLRTLADADALHERLAARARLVVIGAGWIGAEVAASARQLDCDVALVELGARPLERVLGSAVGDVYRDLHADHGVAMHMGVGVERLEGSGAVETVVLSDGTRLDADTVLVGVGVIPRTELAESAGLEIANGIVVDEHLQTSIPGIFAAGDAADAFHPRFDTRIRLEHWSAALNQGRAAARGMLGRAVVYDRTPYFFSDQYDLCMEYRGWAPTFDRVVFRGDPSRREFIAFWVHEGAVVAAMNANVWDAGEAIESLLGANGRVDLERLADPDVDLAAFATSAGS